MDEVDISRRFNAMPIPARQALFSLYSAYANRNLYAYDPKTLSTLLGDDKDDVSIKVKLLLDERFLRKTRTGYKLDRQKADSLITIGVLDIDAEKPILRPMTPAVEENPKEQDMDNNEIPEPTFIDQDDPGLIDLNLPLAESYMFSEAEAVDAAVNVKNVNPESLSDEGFEVKVEPKGKNTRFNLVQIMDKSDAGHRIEPPMWLLNDTAIDRIYLISQKGLKFADPDNSVYVGAEQLQFIQQNPHYILGVFVDQDKAKAHGSKFFDTTINGNSTGGYLPHRVGEVFWMLQKSSDGTYCVLPKNAIPAYTMDSRKVEDLTHDEAIAVFVASEKKAEEKRDKKTDASIGPRTPEHKYTGGEDFGDALASAISGLTSFEEVSRDIKLEKKLDESILDDGNDIESLVGRVLKRGNMDELYELYNHIANSNKPVEERTKYCQLITDRMKTLRSVGNVPRAH